MKEILTGINRNEVLRYLGYNCGEIDKRTELYINEAIDTIFKISNPRYTYSVFDIESNNGIQLKGTLFKPMGNDIHDMLKDCCKCIMMAATLGVEFEGLLKRVQIRDMAKAVILDSCGSSAIENICDNIEQMLKEKYENEGFYITDRFSPGYGDMPIGQQKEFITVLDTARRIGLGVTEGGMLVPTKSVTAIIGISNKPNKKRRRGCENCSNFIDCQYRKEGKTCD